MRAWWFSRTPRLLGVGSCQHIPPPTDLCFEFKRLGVVQRDRSIHHTFDEPSHDLRPNISFALLHAFSQIESICHSSRPPGGPLPNGHQVGRMTLIYRCIIRRTIHLRRRFIGPLMTSVFYKNVVFCHKKGFLGNKQAGIWEESNRQNRNLCTQFNMLLTISSLQ